jgi:hypothetical protein
MKSIIEDDSQIYEKTRVLIGTPAYVRSCPAVCPLFFNRHSSLRAQLSSGLSDRLIRQKQKHWRLCRTSPPSRVPSMHRTLRSKRSWSKRLPQPGQPSVATQQLEFCTFLLMPCNRQFDRLRDERSVCFHATHAAFGTPREWQGGPTVFGRLLA